MLSVRTEGSDACRFRQGGRLQEVRVNSKVGGTERAPRSAQVLGGARTCLCFRDFSGQTGRDKSQGAKKHHFNVLIYISADTPNKPIEFLCPQHCGFVFPLGHMDEQGKGQQSSGDEAAQGGAGQAGERRRCSRRRFGGTRRRQRQRPRLRGVESGCRVQSSCFVYSSAERALAVFVCGVVCVVGRRCRSASTCPVARCPEHAGSTSTLYVATARVYVLGASMSRHQTPPFPPCFSIVCHFVLLFVTLW